MKTTGMLASSLLSLALIAGPLSAEEFQRIRTSSDFARTIVDKTLHASWGWVKVGSDGNVTGKSPLGEIAGTWKWRGGFWCRDLTAGTSRPGRDCQAVHVSGDTGVFILDRGRGEQRAFRIGQ